MPRHPPTAEEIQPIVSRVAGADKEAVSTCQALVQLFAEMERAVNAHFARYGLSRGRFFILLILYTGPAEGRSPAELAVRTDVARATITGLLDGLERAGLVRRVRNRRDRRRMRVRLTDGGRAFLEDILPDHFRRITSLMSGLTLSEQDELRRLLAKVRRNLESVDMRMSGTNPASES
jgi:DNA-binding MarR family transcriptional regulator